MNGSALRPAGISRALGALLFVTAVALGPAVANPLPESALLIHVHSWTPNFCQNNPISQCSQIIQYSEIEGNVEFDLFLANPYDFVPAFSDADFTVRWPETWQYTLFDCCCSDAEVTATLGDHEVTLHLDYDAPVDPGALTLIGRFRMQVSGFGALQFTHVAFGGVFYGSVGPAQAGVECTYSYLSCNNLMTPCGARTIPDALELHVAQGGTTSGTLDVWTGWNGGYPCGVQFMDTADWLEVDVSWDEYYSQGLLTASANAAGLAPGEYTAVIRAVSQVVRCIPVTLYVEPVSSVPEADPTREATSWGGLKQQYR